MGIKNQIKKIFNWKNNWVCSIHNKIKQSIYVFIKYNIITKIY